MFRTAAGVIVLTGAAVASGCATGGAANATRFNRDIGTGSFTDVYERSTKVIRQYFFELEREVATPSQPIYLETKWRHRHPFADEANLGVERVQSRIIVSATPRGVTGLGLLYAVNLTVENRVQMRGSMDWSEEVVTDQYVAYADEITEELKRELNVGVRVFGTCCQN